MMTLSHSSELKMVKKDCFKCGLTLDIEDFYKHPRMADGRLGKCKKCTRNDVRINRINNIDKYAKYEIERNKKKHRKEYRTRNQKKIRLLNATRYIAYKMVSNSIKNGSLINGKCEICGSVNVEAHHDDYAKPLSVRWLCFKHHSELHGKVVTSKT